MTSPAISDAVKRVFTDAFTARDIAEPLASFDASTAAADVHEFLQTAGFDVAGIRRDGRIVGFVERGFPNGGACGQYQKECEAAIVLDDTASLLKVLITLDRSPFVFVTVLGNVGGIVTRDDLQKAPVRMWLFGLITLIEMRFSELIERNCPDHVWQGYLSESRREKARALLAERARLKQTLRLLDCLQLSDKGQIIARHEEIRKLTIFNSRRQVEDTVKKLEALRNNLAHAQDIMTSDWGTIVMLCEFINRQ